MLIVLKEAERRGFNVKTTLPTPASMSVAYKQGRETDDGDYMTRTKCSKVGAA